MSTPNAPFDSHEAFMRQFLQCQRELLRYVMSFVPNAHDARDIVQNTAIALWKKRDEFDSTEEFLPWACRFALNETRMFVRTDARWRKFLNEETIVELAARRLDMRDELDERRIHLRECLRKLPQSQRAVVESYYFADATIEELSASSRRSTEAIYKSLQRIRSLLLQCVQQNLVTS